MELSSDTEKALRSVAWYLAKRDHSARELKTKMGRRYTAATVNSAIEVARERGWLKSDQELAKSWTEQLERKGRSHRYISGYLRRHGLPVPTLDRENELQTCRRLLKTKFGKTAKFDRDDVPRVVRFLKYRGFTDALIRRVIYDEKP